MNGERVGSPWLLLTEDGDKNVPGTGRGHPGCCLHLGEPGTKLSHILFSAGPCSSLVSR